MHNHDEQRSALPLQLTPTERDFYLELRHLVAAAGLSFRTLEESTSTPRSATEQPAFYSKSQWGRWLKGQSRPPRKAIRRLAERLATEEIQAEHLLDLWDKAFAPAKGTIDTTIRPRQLLMPALGFVGRAAELAALTALADQVASSAGPVVIVIEGTAGVGKTTLATHVGHLVCDRFPDGQLHVNMHGFTQSGRVTTAADVLPGFLDALGVRAESVPASVADQAALYRSVLAGKRILLVIDNARDAEQVRSLMPGSSGCLVLVTSRNQLTGLVAEGARVLCLEPFTDDEARDLLTRRLGTDRVEREPDAAGELIRLCARLPLALSVAAANAATHADFSLATLVGQFRNRGLDLLDTGDANTTARTVFARSYCHLSEPAARAFRLLGIHPGPDISLPAAASLTAVAAEETRKALDELARAHLIEEHRPDRFTFHDLLRAYAAELAERLDPEADRRAAVHRVLDHYLHTAAAPPVRFSPYKSALRLPPPMPGVTPTDLTDKYQAMAWFEAEAPVLLALTYYAAGHGFDEHAWGIPWAMTSYLNRSGRRYDYVATCRIALAAAERLADKWAMAQLNRDLAHAHALIADYDTARLHACRSLELFRELQDRESEAVVLITLAYALYLEGRYAEGLGHALDAQRMLEEGWHWWTRATLENLTGLLYAQVGKYQEALAHCQRALSQHREAGYRGGLADSLSGLGLIHQRLGDFAQARSCYEQALEVSRDSGHLFGEGSLLIGLGDTLAASGEAAGAREAWLRAEQILGQMSHPLADEARARLATLSQ